MEYTPPHPSIVAPVMRLIGISDIARSILFYRDILGFEIREEPGSVEAVYGPARLQFGTKDYAPNDWDRPRTKGSAILFFQTGDVAAMHASIVTRGGKPSDLEKVNWIKMEMFQIHDPDGHTLWFGQSYDRPHAAEPAGMLQQALPELPCDGVAAAVTYYQEVLGFKINYQQHDIGVMYRDRVTVLLIERTERHTGIGSTGFYIEDADKLYAELKARGANLQGEPISRPWGLRDFRVLDLHGNRLAFSQPFE